MVLHKSKSSKWTYTSKSNTEEFFNGQYINVIKSWLPNRPNLKSKKKNGEKGDKLSYCINYNKLCLVILILIDKLSLQVFHPRLIVSNDYKILFTYESTWGNNKVVKLSAHKDYKHLFIIIIKKFLNN